MSYKLSEKRRTYHREYMRKYFSDKSNPQRYQHQRAYLQKKYKLVREKIFEILGGKCVKCNFLDVRALQIDHINGGGRQHRVSQPGGRYYPSILKDLTKGINSYQLLCANCNWIKKNEKKENPIKRKTI